MTLQIRLFCASMLLMACQLVQGQNVESYGVFGGFNIPITYDQGLQKDPRFVGKVTFRATPVGFNYGYDHVGIGFVISPNYTQIGQQFLVQNTAGGDVGTREVRMDYFSVPIALKIHLNDLAFFRLSAIAAININYLVKGREILNFSASKMKYPESVRIPDEPGYTKVFDGVLVPDVSNQEYVSKDKFNPLQLFAAVGLRSDFDLNDDWSLNFDGRANFGLFDPRKKAYINELKQTSGAPDLYGTRHEIYLSVEVGISRIIQIKKDFKPRPTSHSLHNERPNAPKTNHKKLFTKKKKKKR